eukprot:1311108-Amphidinium_carterae.1
MLPVAAGFEGDKFVPQQILGRFARSRIHGWPLEVVQQALQQARRILTTSLGHAARLVIKALTNPPCPASGRLGAPRPGVSAVCRSSV